ARPGQGIQLADAADPDRFERGQMRAGGGEQRDRQGIEPPAQGPGIPDLDAVVMPGEQPGAAGGRRDGAGGAVAEQAQAGPHAGEQGLRAPEQAQAGFDFEHQPGGQRGGRGGLAGARPAAASGAVGPSRGSAWRGGYLGKGNRRRELQRPVSQALERRPLAGRVALDEPQRGPQGPGAGPAHAAGYPRLASRGIGKQDVAVVADRERQGTAAGAG